MFFAVAMSDEKAVLQIVPGRITKQNQIEQEVLRKAYIFDWYKDVMLKE